jgi:hypothetical protein
LGELAILNDTSAVFSSLEKIAMKNKFARARNAMFALNFITAVSLQAMAAMTTDANGNVGYDTLAECQAALSEPNVKFYQPFTSHPPLKRAGEVDVKQVTLKELTYASYEKGSCDLGVGRSGGRDGVSAALVGKYIPYSPQMPVNAYFNAKGQLVRATMQQCDNNFSGAFPKPLSAPTASSSLECFATVQIPAKFETKTERVVKVPASKRVEVIPATYKTITEQVLVSPEIKRQIPVPATYKTVQETVVVQPATEREEPVPPAYKTVTEQVMVKPESKRLEVIPATFKTVAEQVLVSPEIKSLKVVPAEYAEREETVVERPATTRVETIPPTYKTVSEQVQTKPETIVYEPLQLPLKTVTQEIIRREASSRLEVLPATYKTETQQVLVKAASKRIEVVPAVFETVSERVKVADASREWKRGRAWVGRAIDVRPLKGFVVSADGRASDGNRVEIAAAANSASRAAVETRIVGGNNDNLDDDVLCLIEVPEQFQMIQRQVLKTPASTREVDVPAQYTTVTRRVIDREATTREIDIPETMQTITSQVIDVERLKAAGYKFDVNGDITATPQGERVLRAASVRQAANSAAGPAGNTGTRANEKSAGAGSGAEAYVREVKIPAQFATVTRQEIDRPASVRTVEVPGTTKVVKTRVEINPARTEEVVTPAVYRTVTTQVIDKPASTREIVQAAEFRSVERRVIDTPASTRKIPVPAVTQVVSRTVVDRPASLREETIPAVYRSVSRQVVDTAASTREIDVPAQYEEIQNKVKTADARIERRSILCETNATPAKIMEIQRALASAGYNPGSINGVLRAQTMQAVNAYQVAKSLPVDGFLNLETVKSLGVSPN